ncbi:S phase cyclin A-associated protein in the endoplasmic reticulum [Rhynchospora pubera]|uniref:S phase cyclin A-associated protein in the endoplasmic reticulum n=1 Tax=Rhynchospora pubera TaxID=906938 RepID=A0AAV8D8E1_9POAL|nr:S phase cyclin A-associated protein in the endoplasmic reticulum [Rhynchospora pubera]
MDDDGGAGDDQGSGWLEVKKKQRSSAKLSLQKSTGAGGSFQRTHELPPNNDASSNKLATNWHHKQTLPTETARSNLKERSELHEEVAVLECKKSELHEEDPVLDYKVESPDNVIVGEGGGQNDPKVACLVLNEPKDSNNFQLTETSEALDIKTQSKGRDDALVSQIKTEQSKNKELSPKGCEDTIKQFGVEICKATNSKENISSDNLMESSEVGEDDANDADTKIAGELDSEKTVVCGKAENGSLCNSELPAVSTLTLEGEAGESKERFRQRLWCFLFENLNRAVDEMYLLCELECDMEQIDEAILVLEEAKSDFRELKCRIEGFDSTKKLPSGIPKDGMSMAVKADHQRPHALSWEVRRMTTTPQKAEILSSSLEAFKKIQLELARKHAGFSARDLVPSNSAYTASSSGKDDTKLGKQAKPGELDQRKPIMEKLSKDNTRQGRVPVIQNPRAAVQSTPSSTYSRSRREPLEPITETEKTVPPRRNRHVSENKQEKQNPMPWKSMDAWKEKRNWEDILKSPVRNSSRVSHSPGIGRRANERARVLHDKLMSPEKKKRTAVDMKKEAEEKHARATRIRNQLESERVQRLQRTSEKLNRVNEWQTVRRLRRCEVMTARQQRGESRHEAYLAQVAKRAGDESNKVNEVRFITSLNEENKKLILRQKLLDSEMRRAEKLQVIKIKLKEDSAREEAVLERRRVLEAEKLQKLAEMQRKKEEAQARREEERKASSAAREARAVEQLRRKEIRAKAQQEEAELLAQRLAEKLRESEQRRKYYLEQIREKASMDFRDQSSPLQRRSLNRDGSVKSVLNKISEECNVPPGENSLKVGNNETNQQPLKRRIKKIRQRLMALKHDFVEQPLGGDNIGIGYRAAVSTAKGKIGRWLQELQRLRQARKEGTASIGLIVADIIKYLEGRDLELHASRQAGMLDFISSALPASHTSKPEACLVTLYLLRLLRTLLSLPANRSYFLAQNLLPPIIPMLSSSLENYIKVAAASSKSDNMAASSKSDSMDSVAEILDGFLWSVTVIIGHVNNVEKQTQMQDGLVELIVAYKVIHHLRDLFALYDRPQVEGSPFPSSILFGLNLLVVLTSRDSPGAFSIIDWESCKLNTSRGYSLLKKLEYLDSQEIQAGGEVAKTEANSLHVECQEEKIESSNGGGNSDLPYDLAQKDDKNCAESSREINKVTGTVATVTDGAAGENKINLKQPVVLVVSAIVETGLVSIPSLLTAILLQANNKLSSEQASLVLPSNFEEVATGVLKVLNNLACLDITVLQCMLARPDLKMEFFHLISFLLTHCTNKWRTANDQVGLLLLESLLLLGYFALFHPENQAVLRWGKSPTILHKVCDLPFVLFTDPELAPVLAGTLVAACFGSDQNRGVVQQELSTEMLLTVLKSCKQGLLDSQPFSSSTMNQPSDAGQMVLEVKPPPSAEVPLIRQSRRTFRPVTGKGGIPASIRLGRGKVQRVGRVTRACDEWALKHAFPASGPSVSFMLHRRFPTAFLDKAEEFFSNEA